MSSNPVKAFTQFKIARKNLTVDVIEPSGEAQFLGCKWDERAHASVRYPCWPTFQLSYILRTSRPPKKTQTCSCDKFAWNLLFATTAAISRRPFSTSLCRNSLVDVKKDTTAKKTKTPHDVPVRQWISAREGKIEITVCLLASNNFCRRHGWVVEFVISNGHFNQTSRILWLIKNSRPNSSNGLTTTSSEFVPCRSVES